MEAWKHVRAVLLLPVLMTVVIPGTMLSRAGPDTLGLWEAVPATRVALPLVGLLFFVLGLVLMVATIRLFVTVGQGTLAPWNPTQQLVVQGVYRHVRNPMIVGVFFVLLGEALLAASLPLLIWFAVFVVVNAVYLPLAEEPGLVKRFGEDYLTYKQNVPRWMPRLWPWHPTSTGRRSLAIRSIREFRQEVERLNEAHQRGLLDAVGNWSLDQCCQHLGRWIAFSLDGFPFQYAWHLRFAGRLVRLVSWRWLVSLALRPGFVNPPSAKAVEPDALIADGSGVECLLQQIGRIESGGQMMQPSPVEGPITHEQWCYFHLRHADLHLSFQVPVGASENCKQVEG